MNKHGYTNNGFTLIELMITIVIVGVLAKIATTSYMNAIERGRLATAKGVLLETTQLLERSYALNNRYPTDIPAALKQSPKVGDGTTIYFNITYTATSSTYRLMATVKSPYNPGDCKTLIISNVGEKFGYNTTGIAITDSSADSTVSAGCWNR